MQRWLGFVLIALSAVSFGGMAIFARLAYASGVDPATLLCLRFVLAAGVMSVVMLVRGSQLPRGRVLLALLAMGGLGYVGQSAAYFTALTMASAGLVALLLYLYPALVTALAVVVLGERMTHPPNSERCCWRSPGRRLPLGRRAAGVRWGWR